MANDKDFKVKNNIQAAAYNETVGTVTTTTEGYNLKNATYDSVTLNVASQETNPTGLTFNNNGTKLFIIGTVGDEVNEYNLSTAYDITTASASTVFSVVSQDTIPEDIVFKPDGTKMFIVGRASDAVFEYSLSTAFDMSTASYSNNSFSIASQETSPSGLRFNNDGTKMFVIGYQSDRIHEYNLSTAYDITTASYSNNAFLVSLQGETIPTSFSFNADGTRVIVIGRQTRDAFQYSLSTAFDISTASYDNITFELQNQPGDPNGLTFNSDGTKMYVVDGNTDLVYEYSTAATNKNLNLDTGSVFDVQVDDANLNIKLINPASSGQVSSAILLLTNTENAANAFDLSSASYDNKFISVANEDTVPRDIFVGNNDTRMYIAGDTGNDIYQYNLTVSGDISSAVYTGNSIDVTSQTSAPYGLTFKPDGTRMYVSGDSDIFAYNLSTAWDISTASYASETFGEPNNKNVGTCYLKSDGTKLYLVNRSDNGVREYNLSTAWDISTASYNSVAFDVTSQIVSIAGLYFSDDGKRMFTNEFGSGDAVFQYNLSTAWDLSTASYSNVTLLVSSQLTAAYGLAFNYSGTKMYLTGYGQDKVFQYSSGSETVVTYDSSIKFYDGSAPELVKSDETDIISFSTRDGGTTYQAGLIMDGVA